ncbi:MAG: tellurite resistance TerB family protein [Rhodospirillum sp.]|nr:tellurite resistance TerB family protein [Rhodospirillum sp.]MCF8489140.1 tellurite resistance TerB family protein [Rhodospirillum sp.]MCF8502391.1 tellurite resistance TerB family protein [Rhodospirillum sp.]
MLNHHAALIYAMVLTSAADKDMTDNELRIIGDAVRTLPVFRDFNIDDLATVAGACVELLEDGEDGLDKAIDLINKSLPPQLKETAYAVACDVAAADGNLGQEELRFLEIMRHGLKVDRLTAAAIERGTRARFATA